MVLKLYHVDAFSDKVFGGNPAAVVPLDRWLTDQTLQNMACENNLSETAFYIHKEECFQLRWFTPTKEVELCGHGTLATAFVLFNILGYPKNEIVFETKSGKLIVRKNGKNFVMNFPSIISFPSHDPVILARFSRINPVEILRSKQDMMIVLSSENEVKSYSPSWEAVNCEGCRGLVVTAKGEDVDFVSRCFYPELNIDEDPVTGSAHCQMAPYWSRKLGKTVLNAQQLSKRGGMLLCEIKDDRVLLFGTASLYLKGEIAFI